LLTQIILVETITLLISNLDKIIVKTNIFNCCLPIALFFNFNLNFVVTIIINTLRILLTSCIRIIDIVSLSKTFSNNSNCNCNNLFKLFYFLANNLCFSKKTRSIRQIKINSQILCVRNLKQTKKNLSITKKTIIIANSRIAILLIIDLREHTLLKKIKRIRIARLRKSSTTISKTTIIIILRKFFNTINYTISLQTITKYLNFLFYQKFYLNSSIAFTRNFFCLTTKYICISKKLIFVLIRQKNLIFLIFLLQQ